MSNGFKAMCDTYSVNYDLFFRTTDPKHAQNVINIWNKLIDKDLIYKGIYHKKNEDSFNENSPFDKTSPEDGQNYQPVETYFFRLSKFQERLERFYEENQDFITPNFYSNKIKSLLANKLSDVSISRNDSTWGIPVPNSNDIVYVWFDALIGYISAANYNNVIGNDSSSVNTIDIHVIGKDILRFHGILWISLLMALDLPLPRKLLVHGWLLNNLDKISKSLGNYTALDTAIDPINSDVMRYTLINSVKFGYDCEYLPKLFETSICNLKNTFGETLYRVLSLWNIKIIDKIDNNIINTNDKLTDDLNNNIQQLREIVDRADFHLYCQILTQSASLINSYINEKKPWINHNNVNIILYNSLQGLYKLALMAYPITPNISQLIMQSIGSPRISTFTTVEIGQSHFIKTRPIKLFS